MQKKKFIVTLLFAVLSIFMITACSDSSNESNSGGNSGGNNGGGGTVQPEPEPDNLTVKKFYNFDLNKSYLSAYALLSDGSLYTWGDNSDGQLGIGNTDNQTKPVKVTGITGKIKQLLTLRNNDGALLAYFSVYAITEDGSLYAWGYNSDGQLGLGNTDNQTKPVKVAAITDKIKELIVPEPYSYFKSFIAITEDNSLYTWGCDGYGVLGVGDKVVDRNTPMKVDLPGKIKEIITGDYSVYAILEDGSLYVWGDNSDGQLGVGSNEYRVYIPTKVNLHGKIKELISYNDSIYAILEDGSLYAWGYNNYGQLGVGDEVDRNIPTKVNLPGKIKELMLWDNDYASLYAILEDGSLYAWGYNGIDALGNRLDLLGIGSENEYVNTPTKVNLPGKIKELITTYRSVYAILEDGSLYAWGYNNRGLLGVRKEDNIYTPEQVTGIHGTIKYISLHEVSMDDVAVNFLTEDGLLYGTGYCYANFPEQIDFREQ